MEHVPTDKCASDAGPPADTLPGPTMRLSFEDSVRLFQRLGFRVEPGPRPEQVTLIIDAPDHRTYAVFEAAMLPDIAAVALEARLQAAASEGEARLAA